MVAVHREQLERLRAHNSLGSSGCYRLLDKTEFSVVLNMSETAPAFEFISNWGTEKLSEPPTFVLKTTILPRTIRKNVVVEKDVNFKARSVNIPTELVLSKAVAGAS